MVTCVQGKDVAPKDLFLSLEHLLSGDRPADASWHASLKALGSAAGDQDQNVEASREAANSACLTESFTPKVAVAFPLPCQCMIVAAAR